LDLAAAGHNIFCVAVLSVQKNKIQNGICMLIQFQSERKE